MLIIKMRAFSGFWIVGLVLASRTCLADAAVDNLLHNALTQEQQLVTGRVVLDVEHIELRLSPEQIQTLLNFDAVRQRDLATYDAVEKKSVAEHHISFDNRSERLSAQIKYQPGPFNSKSNKSIYDPKCTKILSEFPDAKGVVGGKMVLVTKPMETAESAELWRQRIVTGLLRHIEHHLGVAKFISLDAVTGQEVISYVNILPPSRGTTRFYFETHNHYFISRMQGVNSSGVVCYEAIVTPQSYPGGIVYPSRIEETYSYPTRSGGSVTYQHETNTVRVAELNIPLEESTFDFGKYPRNSRVNDSRFPKPISYNQGIVQFTDEQLFQATKDPDYLMNLELEAQRKELASTPPPGKPLASLAWQIIALEAAGVAALLLLIGLALWRWRSASGRTGQGKR